MSRPPLLERSLAVVAPQVAAQLHPTRNGTVTADTVSAGSPARLWWACPRGHDWQTGVKDRARATGWSSCTGRRVTAQTSLAAVHPQVAAEWAPTTTVTGPRQPVHPISTTTAWWRCPAGHQWEAVIRQSHRRRLRLPLLRRPARHPATSLAGTHPDLAAQWDDDRNGDLKPIAVRPGSSTPVWWQCPAGHSWRAQIHQRAGQHTGCPECASHAKPGRLLATTRPDLAAHWSDLLNAGGPGRGHR